MNTLNFRFMLVCWLSLALLTSTLFTSCQKEETSSLEQIATENTVGITFTDEDNRTIKVNLVEGYEHSYRTFATEDAYGDELDRLSDQGKVTVNKALYEKLKHFCDPVEISLLDEEGKYEIAGKVYQFTDEALYTWQAGKEAKKEMSYFYGKDGKADLKEIAFIMRNRENPDAIANYNFINKHMAKDIIQQNSVANAKEYGYSPVRTLYDVRSEEGMHSTVEFQAVCWNRSYRISPRKFRSSAGTQMRASKNNGAWRYLDNSNWFRSCTYGNLGKPKITTKVNGGAGIKYEITYTDWSNQVIHGRRKNNHTVSDHWVYYYFYNTHSRCSDVSKRTLHIDVD